MFKISDLNNESVRGYRNSHRFTSEGHPFEKLSDEEYLRSIGAAAISEKDGKLYPTVAGLLMFGNEYDIVRKFPEYFLDYRESMDPAIRWTDRVYSSVGDWSGNLFDFYYRVYNKIKRDIKVPFAMKEGRRIDDTPIHKAVREALANCLINADYFGVRGIVIKKDNDSLVFENPGYIRTGKYQMRKGGVSDPRNKALMKMFNLLDIGERSGSGVPSIFDAWNEEGYDDPIIDEMFDPDRTVLTLPLIKTGDKKSAIKISNKTMERILCIYGYMEIGKEYSASQLIEASGVKESRLRDLLNIMTDEGMLISKGEKKNRVYTKLPRIDV